MERNGAAEDSRRLTVLTRVPFAQAFALNGPTDNPFLSPTNDCLKRLARYFEETRPS